MAIMKWGTPPKGDAHERHAHVVGHGDGVSLQHSTFGDLVQGGAQVSSLNENYDLATRWSTAPYRGDEDVEFGLKAAPNPFGYRDASRQGKCTAKGDTCNGTATRGSEWRYCHPHHMVFIKTGQEQ